MLARWKPRASKERRRRPRPRRSCSSASGFWGSKTLLSAVELGLFTELAATARWTPRSCASASASTRAAPATSSTRSSRWACSSARTAATANTPATDLFLDRAKPSYVGGMLEMANARLYRFWGSLTEGLRTGEPQNEAKTGGDLFEALYADPERLRAVRPRDDAASASGAALAIAGQVPVARTTRRVIDIGCAEGGVPVQIALAHEHLSGRRLRPAGVAPIFDDFVAPLRPRRPAQLHARRLLRRPPAPGRRARHGPHPPRLGPRREAELAARRPTTPCPTAARLIVYEAIIDDERRSNAFGLLMSLNMLIETPRRLRLHGRRLPSLDARGRLPRELVEHLVGPDSMVVGIK